MYPEYPGLRLTLGKDTINSDFSMIGTAWDQHGWIPAVHFFTRLKSPGSPKTLYPQINFLPELLACAEDFFMGDLSKAFPCFFSLFTVLPYRPALLSALHFPLLSLLSPTMASLCVQPLHSGSFSPVTSSLCLHTQESDTRIAGRSGIRLRYTFYLLWLENNYCLPLRTFLLC